MRDLKCGFSFVAVVAVTFTSLSIAEEPAKLLGRWKVTSAISDGRPRDAINFDGMHWVIGKDSLEITPGRNTPAGLAGKPTLKCTYAVDDTQSPAHFDWTAGDGDRKETLNAIYELKGDVLRICFASRGHARPDGFDTKERKCVVYEVRRSEKGPAAD